MQFTYQSTQVVPDFRNVGVQSNSSRVSVESITVLVDLVVEHTNRAPEGRVLSVTVDGLLVCLICLGVLLLGHVAPTQEVPALGILVVYLRVSVKIM